MHLFNTDCDGFIVPQEVSSLLSVVYSNIPPIKKGTDSRIGFGFRLGEHADFQTVIELGPQKYTKSLGKLNQKCVSTICAAKFHVIFCFPGKGTNDDSGGSDTSKRMVKQSEYNKVIKVIFRMQNPFELNY